MVHLKFSQLTISDWMQDGVVQMCSLKSRDLRTAIVGSETDCILFEMSRLFLPENAFPLKFSTITVPQDRPCSKFLRTLNISEIYEKCTVLESQELAMEPMLLQHPKKTMNAKLMQIDFVPQHSSALTLLTSYGACQLWTQNTNDRTWMLLKCIDTCFFKAVATDMCNVDMRNLVNTFWITAFAWMEEDKNIIFIATASGNIMALCFIDGIYGADILECGKQQTNLNRITYMKSFSNFLLVGNTTGSLNLFIVEKRDRKYILTETESLWNKNDSMGIQITAVSGIKGQNSYYLLITKAAHILAYVIASTGTIVSNSTLYIGGIKISGLEMLSENEFIATTISGSVHYIQLSYMNDREQQLKIETQLLDTDFDTTNMQILGLSKTQQNGLWYFLLCRNKEYTHSSKFSNQTVFLSVNKLSELNILKFLETCNLATFDPYIDHLIKMRIEIFNGQNIEHYNLFCDLEQLAIPAELDNSFLQKLQLKYNITKYIALHQRSKLGNPRKETNCILIFLEHVIQIVHISCKLAQMQEKLSMQMEATNLQKLSVHIMQTVLQDLLFKLNGVGKTLSFLSETIHGINSLALANQKTLCTKLPVFNEYEEKCKYCEEQLDAKSLQCPNSHDLRRCCITYLQVPLFSKYNCEQCDSCALDDDIALQELFVTNEDIKCTYCRFAFMK